MKRTLILFAFFISHICFAQNSSEEIIERTVDEIDKFSIPSYFYVKRFLGTESNFVNFCQLFFEHRN